ncbi:MAG: hypothetical protein HYU56_00700 [Candidatus Aenigmarchaeota archaeon]|nr:hypothetical protein [Candidatus Aenigmarchaeota archaeon]
MAETDRRGIIRRIGRGIVKYGILAGALAGAVYLAGGKQGMAHGFYRARDYVAEKTSEPMTTHDRQFRITKYAIDKQDPTKLALLTDFKGDPLKPLSYGRPVRFTVEDDSESIKRLKRDIEDGLNQGYAVFISRGSPTRQQGLQGKDVAVDKYNGEEQWFVKGADLVKLHKYDITTDVPEEPKEKPFRPVRANNLQTRP